MARQRHCRRLARNGKPAASLLTPSSSEPRTPAGKARVFDARKWLRERDGLSAGGRWIRTSGSAREEIKKFRYPVGVQLILFMGPSKPPIARLPSSRNNRPTLPTREDRLPRT